MAEYMLETKNLGISFGGLKAVQELNLTIKKGEKIRIDISSADNAHYVRHTNIKGLYSEQKTAKVAHNTIYLKESCIMLPIDLRCELRRQQLAQKLA